MALLRSVNGGLPHPSDFSHRFTPFAFEGTFPDNPDIHPGETDKPPWYTVGVGSQKEHWECLSALCALY